MGQQTPLAFAGMLSVRAVIESGSRPIRTLHYDTARAAAHAKELAWLRHRGEEMGFPIHLTDGEELAAIAGSETHGGVCALCGERPLRPADPEDILQNGFYLMLAGIEDPFNFGFAVRSAYAAGVDGILLPPRSFMDSAGVVCRSSAGASERISMYLAPDANAFAPFRKQGYEIVAADLRESENLWETCLARPLVLIVGGEKRGISRSLLDACDRRVHIPYGRAFDASLSAASAAAILCFEVARQHSVNQS